MDYMLHFPLRAMQIQVEVVSNGHIVPFRESYRCDVSASL